MANTTTKGSSNLGFIRWNGTTSSSYEAGVSHWIHLQWGKPECQQEERGIQIGDTYYGNKSNI